MDHEIDICCCKKNKRPFRCCVVLIIYILSVVLAFAIGIVVGALTTIFSTLGLGAFIAIIITVLLLLIVRIIMLICNGDKDKKKYC